MKRELETELAKWKGVVGHHFESGGKHPRLVVWTAGGRRFLPYTTTHIDPRGMRNKISDLRRVLRELGAEKD